MILAADYEQLGRALRDQGVPEGARASDEQLAAALRTVPVDVAGRYLRVLRDNAAEGVRCWEYGHDSQIEHWRRTAIERATRS